MEFKEVMRWVPDNMSETTCAVVVVSDDGSIVKRLPYKKWNQKNKGYSSMKEYIYKQSCNRGKQRFDSAEKIAKHGLYKHVEINGKYFSVHRLVATAFIMNKNNHPCVNHIDGNRSNNHFLNLEWVTNQDNVNHAWSYGIRTKTGMRKITDDDILQAIIMRQNKIPLSHVGRYFNVTGEAIRVRILQYENSIHSKIS